ncbi:VanW family protein [Luteipulveratus sp. YIM 133132]|uniref:VanW family protein n=1 Tax=Luteipulveratus flavus TaxID=3031728 RepID=UPI0023AFF67D|nr:VanW family protein [Luteipulveratus sp. YIM 133132]MDE9365789.1 VanW family protein [Luteipulveratus sp. YIM 133132]
MTTKDAGTPEPHDGESSAEQAAQAGPQGEQDMAGVDAATTPDAEQDETFDTEQAVTAGTEQEPDAAAQESAVPAEETHAAAAPEPGAEAGPEVADERTTETVASTEHEPTSVEAPVGEPAPAVDRHEAETTAIPVTPTAPSPADRADAAEDETTAMPIGRATPSSAPAVPAQQLPGQARPSAQAPAASTHAGDDEDPTVVGSVSRPTAAPDQRPAVAAASTRPPAADDGADRVSTASSSARVGFGDSGDRPSRTAGLSGLLGSTWARVGAVAVVLIAAYLVLALWQGGRISSGTTVAGVDVGGLSKADATTKLEAESARVSKLPVTVTVGDGRAQVQPASAGLSVDVARSLDGLGGSGIGPGHVFGFLGGGEDRPAVVRTDRNRLADAVDDATRPLLSKAPVDGKVSFENGKVKVVRSTSGQGIDADALAAKIGKEWPANREYSTTITERDGRLTNEEIDRFVSTFADKAMSEDLTVTDGRSDASLSPKQLSRVLSVKNDRGRLSPVVDTEKLADTLMKEQPEFDHPARNARIELAAGQPKITPGEDGSKLDRAKLGAAVLAGLTSEDHKATVATTPVKPRISTEEAKAVNTTTAISEFRSRFPGGPTNVARTKNIKVALSILNGQVVAPGEQFSLVQALGGEMTPEQGYVEAPTIQDGHERAALGGGVSQVSTTMYNTAFFAGVQLDEHKAHSFWISRYPMGREATLWIPVLDNKWTNTTGAPILIQAGTEGNEVVMRFYGKKTFTVETTTGKPYDYSEPKTIYDDHPGCIKVFPQRGFSVKVTRVVKQGGAVVKNETTTTTYKAANNIICGKAPSGSPSAPTTPKPTAPPQD